MKYLAVLGRQTEISVAELEALGVKVGEVQRAGGFSLAEVEAERKDLVGGFGESEEKLVGGVNKDEKAAKGEKKLMGGVDKNERAVEGGEELTKVESLNEKSGLKKYDPTSIDRLGGVQKVGVLLEKTPLEELLAAPEGKITFGISDFSAKNGAETRAEALKIKRKLVQRGRSVRMVENKTGVLSNAASLHNGLAGKNPRKIEFLRFQNRWYRVTGVQGIDAYAKRDQKRPARDAKIGMLPPKLAQVLLNLAGAMPPHSRILDPFCGTGVVLQEALLMGYRAYGTDIEPRMVEFSRKNLEWLGVSDDFEVAEGDATRYRWGGKIDAVVTEGYLGKAFSAIPSGEEVRGEILICKRLVAGFLRNLGGRIREGTRVVLCMPAWLRESGEYLRLNMLDEIEKLGYNVDNKTREGLIYHREGQVVARDIIILRKK